MKAIRIEKGLIFYYGSAAGYVSAERAVVDVMFATGELERFLQSQEYVTKIHWKEGVFEQLSHGQQHEDMQILKSCRIWQLKPESDIMMRFIGYEELQKRFGEPNRDDYQVVYDGVVESNELEILYETFTMNHPPGYTGHSLSISDIVELYDEQGSEYYYCDMIEFQEIAFNYPVQDMQMNY